MFNSPKETQSKMEFVYIGDLVPEDHLLRKIDKYIDFSFIREKTKEFYCENNGRPSIDPIVLFKILFIGYLYGIRSERQIIKEIEVNVAYRWFLKLSLTDPIPHHSTISQNRKRKFNGTNIMQDIFDEIVLLGIKNGLIEGKTLFTDSTHLKANANKHKFTRQKVKESTKTYLDELDDAISKDREAHGKKTLKEIPPSEELKEVKVSTTDKDSGYMCREGKPEGFFYLDHRTVDGKLNLITDVHVTAGNVHDSIPYLERLDRQRERFGFDVQEVALDAGYLTMPISYGLEQRDIFGVIGHRRYHSKKGLFHKWQFKYDKSEDCYICPENTKLIYRTTNRKGYREYVSNHKLCANCPNLMKCTKSKNHAKLITRHVWEDSKEKIRVNRLSDKGKVLYSRRKETIERSFADSKELHGLRYARYRGISKVVEQCLLTAACQNIKKIATYLWKRNLSSYLFSFINELRIGFICF
ncbi:MAG: IS1182 family transposase, partial [Calditerrivibrio sp.]|nr:IS1182 family transposase [Calditerrivibrio sp.]